MTTFLETSIKLAAARRLTRLITQDEISRPIREHQILHKHEKLTYLLHCPICVAVYTSSGVVLFDMLFPRVAKPVLTALALSEAQATLIELEAQRDALEQDFGPAL